MADDKALATAAADLSKKIEAECATSDTGAKRRCLFGELALLRNKAEAANDTETLEVLDAQRSKLKIAKQAQTSIDKVSMYIRLLLTAVMALWGSLCLLVMIPLRLSHPVLRQFGVRNGNLPLDILIQQWAKGVLAAAGVKVTVVGAPVDWITDTNRVGIIVYNHASNLDPFIVQTICNTSPKYIGKKVLFKIPILGWFFMLCGMVPINRGDREKAVATMNKAVVGIMNRWQRSVAIAPEGTRSTDGHLRLPFKKGVFHLQDQTKVPLFPILIYGAYELWPPGRAFADPGHVTVSFLPEQKQVAAEGDHNPRDATRLALQQGYSETIAEHADRGATPLTATDIGACVCRFIMTLFVYWAIWRLLCSTGEMIGLGTRGWTTLFIATSLVAAFYVEKFL